MRISNRKYTLLALIIILMMQCFTVQQAFAFETKGYQPQASTLETTKSIESSNLVKLQGDDLKSLKEKEQVFKITQKQPNINVQINEKEIPQNTKDAKKEIKLLTVSAPSVPQNLIASTTDNAIKLYWDASPDATGYDVEIDNTQVLSVTDSFYNQTSLLPNAEHTYRVRAKNSAGLSNWSEELKANTLQQGIVAPTAIISMKYDDKLDTFIGPENVNNDTEIYKTTQISWKSISTDYQNGTITDVEWSNKKEYYDSYQQQVVRLRVKSSSGVWSDWTQVKFNLTNRPPIANLEYVILNPDSIVNGNVTTNTKIAWLWSYNGQAFSYDPDGDAISNINIDGIPSSSVLGYFNGNIGFETQFNVPAQYTMKFKCKDSQGLWSNEWNITFNVEPADGNHRPQCIINYSTLNADTNTQIVWGWYNSKDSDPGDSIAGIEASVMKDGQYYDINTFKTNQDNNGIGTKFPEAGQYTILFRVKDNHGAWSDWVSNVATITDAIQRRFSEISIVSNADDYYGYYNSTDSPLGLYWFGEEEAFDAFKNNPSLSPSDLLYSYSLKTAPSGKVVGNGFTVYGKVDDVKGNPVANAPIAIGFAFKGKLIKQIGTTDGNGKFSLSIAANQIPERLDTKYTFISNYCTNYMEPSTLYVVCGGVQEQRDILIQTSSFSKPINIYNPNMSVRKSIFLIRKFINFGDGINDWYDMDKFEENTPLI